MEYWKNKATSVRRACATDTTLVRTIQYASNALGAAPHVAADYVIEKAPVVHWLPSYNPRWLLHDTLAGLTVGVLLIPQSLAYAKIATIPGEYGLMSSWLPNFLYFIMGTSKDLSTGPTSLMGLLTAEIIRDTTRHGYKPQAIASAVAMSVGIYSMAIGLLKLGFLLDFISVPALNGFISAAAIVIMLGQIPSLFGIDAPTGTANIIHDLFAKIPHYNGPTAGVGLGGILMLYLMQKMGQRWGNKSKIIWLLALGRSAVVLVLFTGISYAVNKHRTKNPVFALSKVKSNGIAAPHMPDSALIGKVFPRAIAPFIAAALETLAIAKAFGRKNEYVTDAAQELVYMGFANFFNAFFSSMPVGGAMSRTAVNSDSGVKSPAYGVIAGSVVILCIFKLSPALYWIPKATLAAIIVTAVWHIVVPLRVFYHYWRTSLIDFITAMLAFWLTLFVSSEVGIGTAVGFNLAYHILFIAFHRVQPVTCISTPPTRYLPSHNTHTPIPPSTLVFSIHQSLLFFNAYRLKNQCLDHIQTHTSGDAKNLQAAHASRNWSVAGTRRARALRRKAGIFDEPVPLRLLVLDLTHVHNIDTTGLTALRDLQADVAKFSGPSAQLRLAGLNASVKDRFLRFGWRVGDAFSGAVGKGDTLAFARVEDAVFWRGGLGPLAEDANGVEPVEVHVSENKVESV